ncbi:hypothetical protein VTN96DRAFT_2761 [Rasamsonia emersonii]
MRVPDREHATIRCSDGTRQKPCRLQPEGSCPKGASPLRLRNFIQPDPPDGGWRGQFPAAATLPASGLAGPFRSASCLVRPEVTSSRRPIGPRSVAAYMQPRGTVTIGWRLPEGYCSALPVYRRGLIIIDLPHRVYGQCLQLAESSSNYPRWIMRQPFRAHP